MRTNPAYEEYDLTEPKHPDYVAELEDRAEVDR